MNTQTTKKSLVYQEYLVRWEGDGVYILIKGKLTWQTEWQKQSTLGSVERHMKAGRPVAYITELRCEIL
jgi:hypothetical protein